MARYWMLKNVSADTESSVFELPPGNKGLLVSADSWGESALLTLKIRSDPDSQWIDVEDGQFNSNSAVEVSIPGSYQAKVTLESSSGTSNLNAVMDDKP